MSTTYLVNGQAHGLWRVDRVTEDGPHGFDMINNPFALVKRKEDADLIERLLTEDEEKNPDEHARLAKLAAANWRQP